MIPYMSERSRERFPYPGFDGHTLEQVRALRVRFDLGDESFEAETSNTDQEKTNHE